MGAFRYLIVGRHDCGRGVPWNSRPRHGRRDRARRRRAGRSVCTPPARRRSGRARRRARSGAARRSSASSSCSAGASRRSTSTRTRRRTTPARPTRTSGSCSLPAGRRAASTPGTTASSTTARCRPTDSSEVAGEGVRATVIGGGFIGSEVAAALAMNDCAVTIVFPDPGVGARIFLAELASFVSDYYRSKGVDVRDGQKVESISRDDGSFVVATEDGEVGADVVVAGLDPAANRPRRAGRARGRRRRPRRRPRPRRRSRGRLRRGRCRPLPRRGARRDTPCRARGPREHPRAPRRREHGRRRRPLRPPPVLLPDLFDLGYEAVGDVDSRLDTSRVGRAQPQGRRLLRRGREAARIPALGRVDRVDAARDLIRASKPVTADQLRALVARAGSRPPSRRARTSRACSPGTRRSRRPPVEPAAP